MAYEKIEYNPTAVSPAKKAIKPRSGMQLEAFGPRGMMPKEFYSKHNLEVKYQTRNPMIIFQERLRTAKKYGFDAAAYRLTPEDKAAMLKIDYLDALLMSYRERVANALVNKEYMENLHSNWTWENVLEKEWNSRPAPRMLSNFCKTMASADLMLNRLQSQPLPAFIKAWLRDERNLLESDLKFFMRLKGEFDTIIKNKMEKVAKT